MAILVAGGVTLPPPVSISTSDEIIWSEDTGRSASGLMVGDIIAEKKTINVNWGVLTETEVGLIKSRLIAGFFPVTFRDDGVNITIDSYRGTMTKEHIGRLSDGIYYYRSCTVSIIQR